MIKIKKVTMTNFLSYGAVPTIVDFEKPGTTLIVGKNGVGKTSIINAMVYGIFDKPISQGIPKDELVNNINKRRMKVIVEFSVNDISYKVERARKMKTGQAGNYVKIFKNDKDITPDSVYNANDLIVDIIGIDYELFVRIVTFAATHKPFLDLPIHSAVGPNQTDIIEELFDLKTLSDKADLLKEKIKDNEQSLKIAKKEIEFKKREKEKHNEQISSAELRIAKWNKTNEDDIQNIIDKINAVGDIDIEEQKKLNAKSILLTSNIQQLKNKCDSNDREIKRKDKENKKLAKEIEHLGNDECPYCKQKYPDAASKVKELQTKLEGIIEELEKLIDIRDDCNQKSKEFKSELKKVDAQIIVDNIDELMETKSNMDQLKYKLNELQNAKNPHIEALEELKEKSPARMNMSKINRINNEIDHQKFLHKILTKKDSFVRKALLDRNIPYLNKQLGFYLNELGLRFAVEFTHEMTARITSFGNEMSFANMSAGQKSRINLALSFAFRDVLQNLHSKINVCLMDEVLDVALDIDGIQIATQMLKNRAISEKLSLYIISHKSEEIDAFEKRMIISMEDGFSKIDYE